MPIPVIAITAAIELIRFVLESRNLKDKTPEEVLDLWAASRTETQDAITAWNASKVPAAD